MDEEKPSTLKRELIGCSILYWIPAALFIWITSVLGDCFETDAICEASRREGMIDITLWAAGLFIFIAALRFAFGRKG